MSFFSVIISEVHKVSSKSHLRLLNSTRGCHQENNGKFFPWREMFKMTNFYLYSAPYFHKKTTCHPKNSFQLTFPWPRNWPIPPQKRGSLTPLFFASSPLPFCLLFLLFYPKYLRYLQCLTKVLYTKTERFL